MKTLLVLIGIILVANAAVPDTNDLLPLEVLGLETEHSGLDESRLSLSCLAVSYFNLL